MIPWYRNIFVTENMSENEMMPLCQLLHTGSLITDYYMQAKTIERNTIVDISFPHSS